MDTSSLQNAARTAARSGRSRFTRFLDPAEQQEAHQHADAAGISFASFGGYDGAERALGCFFVAPDFPENEDYPIQCLRSAADLRFSSLTHRDVLGAFMALGLTRDCLGDIIISGQEVFLFSTGQTVPLVMELLTSAGKTPLHFSPCSACLLPEPKGDYRRGVVSSLRLDAVLAEVFHLSRGKASDSIRAGKVKVNYLVVLQTDMHVPEGAMLSLAGQGRASLRSVDGITRKQNIGITYFRYA